VIPVVLVALTACGAAPARIADPTEARAMIETVIDDWHDAAARSDLERYMAHLTDDAIFLGTDATERWTKAQLLEYARAPFAEGRGWVMRPVRRDVMIDRGGSLAFFDEDLEAVNLGAARGSGVLRLEPDGRWRIAHYNLAITVPNERFEAVRDLLRSEAPPNGE
jgi:ketosteroid isomerase-like protein